ncbi:hypothetical protein GGR56DRAFT_468035 [Xylariaceae sp. FL0804]|nr:hypothetical protein GGR56DRAFT_468035 [Xylariaceae sp. FL0804]
MADDAETPDPRNLPRDPRLAAPSTYDRDATVRALTRLYSSLPHLSPADVQRAPAGGWPEVTAAAAAARGLRKTARALDLLRHLPYLAGPLNTWVAPEAYALDWRVVVGGRQRRPRPLELLFDGSDDDDDDDPRFPPWVVELTTGSDSGAKHYMLDTSDGTVTQYVVTGAVYPDPPGRYAADDPRRWRDQFCEDWTRPVEELVDDWIEKHRSLVWVGVPGKKGFPGVLWHQEDDPQPWMLKQTTVSLIRPGLRLDPALLMLMGRVHPLGYARDVPRAWMA